MREPGTPADHLREDFVFSHIGVVPIQLTGERQPFLSAKHVSSSGLRVRLRMVVALDCPCKLETNRVYGIISSTQQSRQHSCSTSLNDVLPQLCLGAQGRGHYGGTPMSPSRSSIPETRARPDEPLGQQSATAQIPDDPETNEFHLRRVMDTIPGLVWSAFPDGGVEFCNQSWLDYTGLSLDKVRGGELV